eukprot:2517219-Pyramimonas_sp.AAC.1
MFLRVKIKDGAFKAELFLRVLQRSCLFCRAPLALMLCHAHVRSVVLLCVLPRSCVFCVFCHAPTRSAVHLCVLPCSYVLCVFCRAPRAPLCSNKN